MQIYVQIKPQLETDFINIKSVLYKINFLLRYRQTKHELFHPFVRQLGLMCQADHNKKGHLGVLAYIPGV